MAAHLIFNLFVCLSNCIEEDYNKKCKAIDEYSRFCYLEAFEEHSSYSSAVFHDHMLKAFKFKVECVQTDNGAEFTKWLGSFEKPTPTLFEKLLNSVA